MYHFNDYKSQYAANIRLALPVALTHVGQMVTQIADNTMVGQFGGDNPLPLAAVAFGGSISFLFFIVAISITFGLTPLTGERFAQKDRHGLTGLMQNGLSFYTLAGFGLMGIQLLLEPLLYHLGQPIEVVDAALPYYRLMAYSLPFVMLFFAFKQFLEGLGNTHAELIATIIANVANIGLNWVFIYGHWGAPEMGVTGAGVATLLARVLTAVIIIVYFCRRTDYRIYLEGYSLRSWHYKTVGSLIRIGLPVASQMFLEASAFIGTSIMMGWLGAVALGTNQIAVTIGNCAWMIVTSIGAATTIRVSHCLGARDVRQLSLAAKASLHLVLVWNSLAAVVFLLLRNRIPLFFTTNPEVIAMTSSLMIYVALYQLSDGLQGVSVGILRGLQDVRPITPIAILSYWVLNLPLGYLFCFTCGMGPAGFFLGYFFGLSTAAVLMLRRIRHKIHQLHPRDSR